MITVIALARQSLIVCLGFTKSADRPTKRLKKSDEEPKQIEESDGESDCESDAGGKVVKSAPVAKKGKGKAKKESKSDGWIWMEGMIGREGATSEKMVEYKRESEWMGTVKNRE